MNGMCWLSNTSTMSKADAAQIGGPDDDGNARMPRTIETTYRKNKKGRYAAVAGCGGEHLDLELLLKFQDAQWQDDDDGWRHSQDDGELS